MKKFLLLISVLILACGKEQNSGGPDLNSPNGSVGGSLATFIIKGDYLYVVDSNRLNVFHIEQPEHPNLVNRITVGFDIETLYSLDEYLFIGSRNGMYIYSVKMPETPQQLSSVQHFRACDPVVATKTHAFVTLHSSTFCGNNVNELQIYEINDPSKPKLISRRGLTYPRGLAIAPNEKYLFVCDDELKIFSIENPNDTRFLRAIPKNYKDIIFHDNKLFAFGEREITQFSWSEEDFSNLKEISTLKY